MRLAVQHELHALPWRTPRPGAHAARAALFFTLSQAEAGHGCPISMTFSSVPALRAQPEIAAEWEPRLMSTEYDPRTLPASQKHGALCGMAMTAVPTSEKSSAAPFSAALPARFRRSAAGVAVELRAEPALAEVANTGNAASTVAVG